MPLLGIGHELHLSTHGGSNALTAMVFISGLGEGAHDPRITVNAFSSPLCRESVEQAVGNGSTYRAPFS